MRLAQRGRSGFLRCGARKAGLRLGRVVDRFGHGVEGILHPFAKGGDGGQRGQGDERGDQAVLDGRGAGAVGCEPRADPGQDGLHAP